MNRKQNRRVAAILLLMAACSARADYVEMARTSGALTDPALWEGGEVPSGSSTGLVTSAIGNVWTGPAWDAIAIRQMGGHVYAAGGGNLTLRGGAAGSGIATIYEIEDGRGNYGSYTNLTVSGTLSFWSMNGEVVEMSLLSGHVVASHFSMNAAGGVLQVRDGIFRAGTFDPQRGRIRFLSGGAGEVDLGRVLRETDTGIVLDFETGSGTSITVRETRFGGTWGWDHWDFLARRGWLLVDGVPVWSLHFFIVSEDGTTLMLDPDPGPLPDPEPVPPPRPEPSPQPPGTDPSLYVPMSRTWGALTDAQSWQGGAVPSGASTGLVTSAIGNVWTGHAWDHIAVRQTGGYAYAAGEGHLNLRGGSEGSGVVTIYEIADPRIDYGSYTNLFIPGNWVFWSQYGEGMEFNLWSGHVQAGALILNAAGKGMLRIKDGRVQAGGLKAAGGIIRFLSGGSATVEIGGLDGVWGQLILDFEPGFRGSLTIHLAEEGVGFSESDWQALADAGRLRVSGEPVGLEYFAVSSDGSTLRHIGALPGLAVTHRRVYKDGAVYRGIGVNYCDLFHAMLPSNHPEYPGQHAFRTLEGLRYLGERGVPFVRFWACGFWPVDWELYFRDRDEWFRRMDLLVRTAEEAGVGLIPSLFWRDQTISNLVDEYRDQWGNPDSETRRFMTNYVAEVVGRYADSPAIWGWEFANETNLRCDLPNWQNGLGQEIPSRGVGGRSIEVDERNRMTYDLLDEMFAAFRTEVRRYDRHRFITSGSSRPRASAWHNRMENSWTRDSFEQAREAFGWVNPPGSIGLAQVHVYPYAMSESGVEPEYAGATGIAAILDRYRQFSDEQGQALFIGEYSSFYDEQGPSSDMERLEETAFLEMIIESGADLAAYWVFDRGHDRTETGNIRKKVYMEGELVETNLYRGTLDLILEYDAKMRDEIHVTQPGIPRSWFEQFGIEPDGWESWMEVSQRDLSGNGQTLWQDYTSGLHPLEDVGGFGLIGVTLLPDGRPSVSWRGGTYGLMTPYRIERSTDLTDPGAWAAVGTRERMEGIHEWADPDPVDEGGVFYRIAVPPNAK